MQIKSARTFIKGLTWGSILNLVVVLALVILVISPSAKAKLIQGLMKVGLFQPDVPANVKKHPVTVLPEIILKTHDNRTVNLNDQSDKVVFINFWATWCPPCIAEMPSISGLYEKLNNNNNIVFITVDTDNDFSKSIPFMKKHGYNMPVYTTETNIPESLQGNATPSTVILDKKGNVVFRHDGAADYSNTKVLAYLTQLTK
ncbi:MAG: hypothetical protein NVSMB24_16420 [Mucilaginibacter sp.]